MFAFVENPNPNWKVSLENWYVMDGMVGCERRITSKFVCLFNEPQHLGQRNGYMLYFIHKLMEGV